MTMAECTRPFLIKNKGHKFNPSTEYSHHKVACGKCSACLQRHSRMWIFRLKQELKTATAAHFVTLTYDDQELIFSKSGVPTLHKPDFQNFMKRLRKSQKEKIKYFACGEYGTDTKRPHYHAIIYNSSPTLIENAWTAGIVHIGTVTENSIAYTTKYILKQNQGWEQHQDKSFQKECAFMSKGLGATYMQKQTVKYHKDNLDVNFVTDEKGFKYSMPRYYREKMFDEDERRKLKQNTVKLIDRLKTEQHEDDLAEEKKGNNPFDDRKQKIDQSEFLFKKRINQKSDKL